MASLPRGSLRSPLGPSEVSFRSTSRRSATRSPLAHAQLDILARDARSDRCPLSARDSASPFQSARCGSVGLAWYSAGKYHESHKADGARRRGVQAAPASREGRPSERSDSMEILLSHESVKQVWDARDRASLRAIEHVGVTGPSENEAESWALQPG